MSIYPAGKVQISTNLFMSALYLLLLQEIRSCKQTSHTKDNVKHKRQAKNTPGFPPQMLTVKQSLLKKNQKKTSPCEEFSKNLIFLATKKYCLRVDQRLSSKAKAVCKKYVRAKPYWQRYQPDISIPFRWPTGRFSAGSAARNTNTDERQTSHR